MGTVPVLCVCLVVIVIDSYYQVWCVCGAVDSLSLSLSLALSLFHSLVRFLSRSLSLALALSLSLSLSFSLVALVSIVKIRM